MRLTYIYASPKCSTEEIEDICENALPYTDLIMGDFNAKVPCFLVGSKQRANTKGRTLHDECQARKLLILNPPGVPTYKNTTGGRSAPDLAIARINYKMIVADLGPDYYDHAAI